MANKAPHVGRRGAAAPRSEVFASPRDGQGETPIAEDGLPTLNRVLTAYRVQARRSLGQNFLTDLSLTRRIARAAHQPLGLVVEVGPGVGALTRGLLLEGAEKVVAVERDATLLPALEAISQRYDGRLAVILGDALAIDPSAQLGDAARLDGAQVVANLPYNIGTELLVRWLREGAGGAPWWRQLTVMLQKEVAERATASVGSTAYGRLAVLTAWRGSARLAFDVAPQAFTPPPKVTSSILIVTPSKTPRLDCDLADLEQVTRAAFSQRRKMLRSALKSLTPNSEDLLREAAIDPRRRAETVSPEEFAALAQAYRRCA